MAVFGMDAVTLPAFTNVVVLFTPAKRTVAPLTNSLPFTVNVKVVSPAVASFGETVKMVKAFGVRSTELTRMRLPVLPVLTATMKSDTAFTVCFVEVGLLVERTLSSEVSMNRQGGLNAGLVIDD